MNIISKYLRKLIINVFSNIDYDVFMNGVETGKREITDGPFIVSEPLKVGDVVQWQKGGFLKKKKWLN